MEWVIFVYSQILVAWKIANKLQNFFQTET